MRSRTEPMARSRGRPPAVVAPGAQAVARTFGDLLKAWRTARRYSQLELALETQVSQRHLSFLECGRAGPSRDMAMHLSQVLRVPLRERNDLLMAAGYAPVYPERPLEDGEMAAIRQALETTLRHHEPFPALVVDRQWNVVLHNAAVDRLIGLLGPPARVWRRVDPSGRRNLMRLTLHPQGLQPQGNNQWANTFASGDPIKGVPGDGNLGVLQAGALEESNVDLTGELVSMITAQRTYQANAQTIKTEDQILQTLVNMR